MTGAQVFGIDVSTDEFDLTRAEEGAIKKRTFGTMGRQWHKEMLPNHFQAAAASRYGYTARKGQLNGNPRSYANRKKALGLGDVDLVFTGLTRDLTLQIFDMRLSSTAAKVVLPQKWNLRHPKSRVNMREEVTKILNDEARDLEADGRSAFADELTTVLIRKKRGSK